MFDDWQPITEHSPLLPLFRAGKMVLTFRMKHACIILPVAQQFLCHWTLFFFLVLILCVVLYYVWWNYENSLFRSKIHMHEMGLHIELFNIHVIHIVTHGGKTHKGWALHHGMENWAFFLDKWKAIGWWTISFFFLFWCILW